MSREQKILMVCLCGFLIAGVSLAAGRTAQPGRNAPKDAGEDFAVPDQEVLLAPGVKEILREQARYFEIEILKAQQPLQERIHELIDEVRRLQEVSDRRIDEARQPLEDHVALLKTTMEAVRKENESSQARLQQAFDEKAAEIQVLKKGVELAAQDLAGVQQENLFLRQEMARLQRAAQEERNDLVQAKEAERGSLEQERLALMDAVDAKDAELEEKNQALTESLRVIADLQKEGEDLARDYFEMLDENEDLKKQIKGQACEGVTEED